MERQYRQITLIDFSSFKKIPNINNKSKSLYEENKENLLLEKNDDSSKINNFILSIFLLAINDFRNGDNFVFLNLKKGIKFNFNIKKNCNFDLVFSLEESEENIFRYNTTFIDKENEEISVYLFQIDQIGMNQIELKEENNFKWTHSDSIEFNIIRNKFLQFNIIHEKGYYFLMYFLKIILKIE